MHIQENLYDCSRRGGAAGFVASCARLDFRSLVDVHERIDILQQPLLKGLRRHLTDQGPVPTPERCAEEDCFISTETRHRRHRLHKATPTGQVQ